MSIHSVQGFQIFVNVKGQEINGDISAIELRCPGAGWRWHDQDGNEWGSAGAPVEGEFMPRWVMKNKRSNNA